MASLGDLLVKVGLDASQFNSGMDQVKGKIEQAEKNTGSFATVLGSVGSAAMSAGSVLSASITAPIIGLGSASTIAAGNLEQTRIAYTNLLGSAEKANRLLAEMREFAAKTPFQFEDVTKAGQKLMAMGFSASEILPTLKTIGDAVAGIGGGAAEIDRVTLALGQMQAKGAVSGEEMKQLAELGIPVWQMLADAIGVSVPEAMKLVERKAIQSSEAIPVILAGMNEKFQGMMESQSQTFLGRWSTFKDNVQSTLVEIGNVLLPVAGKFLDFLSGLAEKVSVAAKWFADLPSPIQNAVIAVAALAAAIGPLLLMFGGIATAISSIMTVWPVLVAGFSGLAGVISGPALAIAGLTAALIAFGVWVYSNWETIVNHLTTIWQGWSELFTAIWTGIKDFLLGVWNTIASAVKTIWEPIVDFLGPIFKPIVEYYAAAWQATIGVLSDAWNWVVDTASKVWSGIKEFFITVWDGLKNAATSAWGWITEKIREFIDIVLKIPGVKKILLLDEETRSVQQHGKATTEAGRAVSQHTEEQRRNTTELQRASTANVDLGRRIRETIAANQEAKLAEEQLKKERQQQIAEVEKYKKGLDDLSLQKQVAVQYTKMLKDEVEKEAKAIAEMLLQLQQGKSTFVDVNMIVDQLDGALTKATQTMNGMNTSLNSLQNIGKTTLPVLSSGMTELETAAKNMANQINKEKEAYKTLHLPDPEEVEKKKTAIITAYNEILTNPNSSPATIKAAHKAMIDELDKIEGKEKKFEEFGTKASNAIRDAASNFSRILFDPDSDDSFTERFKKAFGSLKDALEDIFLKPITTSITNFVTNIIQGLLQPALTSVSGVISGLIPGLGGSAAGAAGAAGAGAAGAGAAGAGAAGAAGTILGLGASLIGGLVSGGLAFAGSIVGSMMQSGDLGRIEENTRYTAIALVGSLGVIDLLWGITDIYYKVLIPFLRDDMNGNLGLIADRMYVDIVDYQQANRNYLRSINDTIKTMSEKPAITVNVEGNVIGNRDFIDLLAEELGRRFKLAGG